MTVVEQDRINFTMMYRTYLTFRRYLDRLMSDAAVGKDGSSLVGGGWERVSAELAPSSASGRAK
ncbi:MAG: hypothetical protein ABSA91_06010 [Acidimicrobiales bacterium]|jgi:hypothetical protein